MKKMKKNKKHCAIQECSSVDPLMLNTKLSNEDYSLPNEMVHFLKADCKLNNKYNLPQVSLGNWKVVESTSKDNNLDCISENNWSILSSTDSVVSKNNKHGNRSVNIFKEISTLNGSTKSHSVKKNAHSDFVVSDSIHSINEHNCSVDSDTCCHAEFVLKSPHRENEYSFSTKMGSSSCQSQIKQTKVENKKRKSKFKLLDTSSDPDLFCEPYCLSNSVGVDGGYTSSCSSLDSNLYCYSRINNIEIVKEKENKSHNKLKRCSDEITKLSKDDASPTRKKKCKLSPNRSICSNENHVVLHQINHLPVSDVEKKNLLCKQFQLGDSRKQLNKLKSSTGSIENILYPNDSFTKGISGTLTKSPCSSENDNTCAVAKKQSIIDKNISILNQINKNKTFPNNNSKKYGNLIPENEAKHTEVNNNSKELKTKKAYVSKKKEIPAFIELAVPPSENCPENRGCDNTMPLLSQDMFGNVAILNEEGPLKDTFKNLSDNSGITRKDILDDYNNVKQSFDLGKDSFETSISFKTNICRKKQIADQHSILDKFDQNQLYPSQTEDNKESNNLKVFNNCSIQMGQKNMCSVISQTNCEFDLVNSNMTDHTEFDFGKIKEKQLKSNEIKQCSNSIHLESSPGYSFETGQNNFLESSNIDDYNEIKQPRKVNMSSNICGQSPMQINSTSNTVDYKDILEDYEQINKSFDIEIDSDETLISFSAVSCRSNDSIDQINRTSKHNQNQLHSIKVVDDNKHDTTGRVLHEDSTQTDQNNSCSFISQTNSEIDLEKIHGIDQSDNDLKEVKESQLNSKMNSKGNNMGKSNEYNTIVQSNKKKTCLKNNTKTCLQSNNIEDRLGNSELKDSMDSNQIDSKCILNSAVSEDSVHSISTTNNASFEEYNHKRTATEIISDGVLACMPSKFVKQINNVEKEKQYQHKLDYNSVIDMNISHNPITSDKLVTKRKLSKWSDTSKISDSNVEITNTEHQNCFQEQITDNCELDSKCSINSDQTPLASELNDINVSSDTSKISDSNVEITNTIQQNCFQEQIIDNCELNSKCSSNSNQTSLATELNDINVSTSKHNYKKNIEICTSTPYKLNIPNIKNSETTQSKSSSLVKKMKTNKNKDVSTFTPQISRVKQKLKHVKVTNKTSTIEKCIKKKSTGHCDTSCATSMLEEIMDEIQCHMIADQRELEKLKAIVIQITWELSKVHEIDSGSEMLTHEKLKGMLGADACLLDTRGFTKIEEEKIKQNWEEFSMQYKFKNPELFMGSYQLYGYFSLEQRRNFKLFLAKGLPNRRLFSVYNKFRKLFGVTSRGRWTQKEDRLLITLSNSYDEENGPKKYGITKNVMLQKALSRSSSAIRQRLQILFPQRSNSTNKGDFIEWTASLKGKLIYYLLKKSKLHTLEALKDFKIPSECWEKVSKKIKVPTDKVKFQWKYILYAQIFAEKPVARNQLFIDLITWFHKSSIKTFLKIDWCEVSKELGNLGSYFLARSFRTMILTYVPKRLHKHFRGCIDYLHMNLLPKMMKQKKTKMIQRLRYNAESRIVEEIDDRYTVDENTVGYNDADCLSDMEDEVENVHKEIVCGSNTDSGNSESESIYDKLSKHPALDSCSDSEQANL